MKNGILITVLVIFAFNLNSQEVIFEKPYDLNLGHNDIIEPLPVVNYKTGEVALFLMDNSNIHSVLFNQNLEPVDSFSIPRKDAGFNILLGYSINNYVFYLVFGNESKNQFYTVSIDIVNKQSESKLHLFELKEERFIETISYRNKFYLLSIKNKSSTLKIYEFQGSYLLNSSQYNFSSYGFSSTDYSMLFDIFFNPVTPSQMLSKIVKIDYNNPNPIDLASKENKLYFNNDRLYITIDNNIEITKVISISLLDFGHDIMFYPQGIIECENESSIKSNSFILGDNLYQIKACENEILYGICNLKSKSRIKEFRANENEEFQFINSPLIQESGKKVIARDSEKETISTDKILKKILSGNIAIAAHNSNDNIELTIGGYEEVISGKEKDQVSDNSSNPPVHQGNPTISSYDKKVFRKYIYFKSFVDSKYNHVKNVESIGVFDQIQNFEYSHESTVMLKTIFQVSDYYVFGYYDWNKKYYLRKFKD